MTGLMQGSAHRTALVTGGTRGIGRGIVRQLIAAGVRVATVYHEDESAARALIREGEDVGVHPLVARINVADFGPLEAFVNKTLQAFGRLDYLVNSVGVDIFKPIRDLSFEEWRLSQDVILNAAFHLCRLALAPMRAQRFGRIVNIGASSKDYLHGQAGMGAFGVHKAALTVLTKTLAVEEIAHGITVNMVAPGSTRGAGTLPESQRIPIGQIPLGRRVEIDEIAAAVMYFLSDLAASVTGQCLAVNGGLST
jgi:NAD(P)-dependent dehydrogenase (short-subunit alcohol dehydrogenase family)